MLQQRRVAGVADRNFCTTYILFGIAGRGGSFVIRQHGSTLTWEAVGERASRGRCETGEVFEQTVPLSNDEGEFLVVRRITVELDQPTRDGDRTIHILTNLPEEAADAITVAGLCRKRWTLETAFQELEATLDGEINTLGYPKAALFAFCVALVSYNVLSTLKAALRSVHGEAVVAEQVSGYYVADEIQMTHRGMMIAIPEDEWAVFHDLTPVELADVLVRLARSVPLPLEWLRWRIPCEPFDRRKEQAGAQRYRRQGSSPQGNANARHRPHGPLPESASRLPRLRWSDWGCLPARSRLQGAQGVAPLR